MTAVMCEHGNIEPGKAPECKLISAAAFERLQAYIDLPVVDICPTCIADAFSEQLAKTQHTLDVRRFEEINNEDDKDFVLPLAWLNRWKDGSLPKGSLPSGEGLKLYCEHDGRSNNNRVAITSVTPSAIAYLQSLLGDFPALKQDEDLCEICKDLIEESQNARRSRTQDLRPDRAIKKQIKTVYGYDMNYFLMPERFATAWDAYMANKGDPPVLDTGLCPHGLIDFDPQMEKRKVLTEQGWDLLCQK